MGTKYRNTRFVPPAAAGIFVAALILICFISFMTLTAAKPTHSNVVKGLSRAALNAGYFYTSNLAGPAGSDNSGKAAAVPVAAERRAVPAPPNELKNDFVPDELLVKIDNADAASTFLQSHGLTMISAVGDGTYRVSIGDKISVDKKIAEISLDRRAAFAEPNYIRHATLTPNDPAFASQQWGPQKILAPNAWDVTTGDPGVIVAVVDTGIAYNHPELTGRVINGFDYASSDTDSMDDEGHGTHVAGIIAAAGNNGIGMAGIAWNTRIMAVKVLDSSGSGFDSDVASGIRYAADNGAKVINLSLAGPSFSQTMQNAVNYAYDKGVAVIAAAGNNGTSQVNYPAGCANVVGVASTGQTDTNSDFSNFNSSVDVAAPGEGIYSTYLSPAYVSMSGTSMATPHVAGLAALLYAANPGWTPLQVEQRIESTADDKGIAGRDDLYGWGRINAKSATASTVINILGLAMTPAPYDPISGPLTASFTLSVDSNVYLTVADPDGTVKRRIGPMAKSAGPNSMTWDGLDGGGGTLPPFWYRLTIHAFDGISGVYREEMINLTTASPLLLSGAVSQPSSFNPGTGETAALQTISNKEAFLAETIYDQQMRPVRSMPFSRRSAGTNDLIWDGKDDAGLVVPGGVYTFMIFGSDSSGAGSSVSGTVTVE